MRWYWSLFADAARAASAIGEFSHDYIHSADGGAADCGGPPRREIPGDDPSSDRADIFVLRVVPARCVIRGSFEQKPSKTCRCLSATASTRTGSRCTSTSLAGDRVKVLLFDDLEADPRAFADARVRLSRPAAQRRHRLRATDERVVEVALAPFGTAQQVGRHHAPQAWLGWPAGAAQRQSEVSRAIPQTVRGRRAPSSGARSRANGSRRRSARRLIDSKPCSTAI